MTQKRKGTLAELKSENCATATAKSLQSCPTLCNPIDGSPPGFPRPWDSPGKNTGVEVRFSTLVEELASGTSKVCWTNKDFSSLTQ